MAFYGKVWSANHHHTCPRGAIFSTRQHFTLYEGSTGVACGRYALDINRKFQGQRTRYARACFIFAYAYIARVWSRIWIQYTGKLEFFPGHAHCNEPCTQFHHCISLILVGFYIMSTQNSTIKNKPSKIILGGRWIFWEGKFPPHPLVNESLIGTACKIFCWCGAS